MTTPTTIAPEHLETLVGGAGCPPWRCGTMPPRPMMYYGYPAPYRAAYAPAWWQGAQRRPHGWRWW